MSTLVAPFSAADDAEGAVTALLRSLGEDVRPRLTATVGP